MPCRNTVKHKVAKIANESRQEISVLMKKALVSENGGLSVTTNCWTDDYRHASYMCIVVHIFIDENKKLSYHQFVLSTQEITEYVKTGDFHIKIFFMTSTFEKKKSKQT